MTATQVSDEEANLFAMQLVSTLVLPMVLKASIELDLLVIIAKAKPSAYLSPCKVASHLLIQNRDAVVMLDQIFQLQASYSVLAGTLCDLPDGKVKRLYGLAPGC